MQKYLILLLLPLLMLVSCGDDDSGKSPVQSEFGESSSTAELNSFSEKNSSSMVQSLSSEKSSSSVKPGESSSSLTKESSSSAKSAESSSSTKESSSSEKPAESSSSTKESSSSAKPAESSSSTKESSSSVKPADSSSSESSSSSDIVDSSETSISGICKTKTEDNCVYGTLYDDRDGKTYKTIKIGEQEWMAENLNFKVDVINKTSYRSFCESDSVLCSRYGRLYTWTAAIDSISLYTQYSIQCGTGKKCSPSDTLKIKGVCPNGWHLPNQNEWEKLIGFVGVSDAGKILKGFLYWEKWPGEDSYGFNVLPSGIVTNATIYHRGAKTSLWTSTDYDNFSAQCAQFNYSEVRKDAVMLQSMSKSAVAALPVRCLKD